MSFSNLKLTVAFASAMLLLWTSPLTAALKTKPGATSVKGHSVPSARLHASSRTSHGAAARNSHHARPTLKTVSAKPHSRGQQSIDQARATEIQQALIRENYLNGEATGQWDQATRDALTRFQGDHQWQTKVVPDARALIKLGLGPSRQNLLNPESAAMAMPSQSGIEKSSVGGSN